MRKYRGKINSERESKRARRKLYIRKNLSGSSERPRVCAIKTNKHIQIQVVDDVLGKTLFSLQTYGKKAIPGAKKSREGAKVLGARLAEELSGKGIKTIVFDRNGYKYSGIIADLANEVREKGIQF